MVHSGHYVWKQTANALQSFLDVTLYLLINETKEGTNETHHPLLSGGLQYTLEEPCNYQGLVLEGQMGGGESHPQL